MRDEDKEFLRILGAINDSLGDLNQTLLSWQGPFHVVVDNPTPPPPPITTTTAVLTYAGETMATQLTVDTVNGKVSVGFLDDKGDVAVAPAGLTIAWSSTGATTLAQDPADPHSADITPGPDGDTGTFVAAFNGTALEADGVTAIADPSPLPYTVAAGGAVSAALTES
jgi:hypothetical protein